MAPASTLASAFLLLQATTALAAPTISLPLVRRELPGVIKAQRTLTELARLQTKLQNAKAAWNAQHGVPVTTREVQLQQRATNGTTGTAQLTECMESSIVERNRH